MEEGGGPGDGRAPGGRRGRSAADVEAPDRRPIDEYTARLGAEIDEIFGDRTVGVWLLGSWAYGGATSSSDIDTQACVRRPLPAEIDRLVERIAHPHLWCPAVGLEFVLYDESVLRSPSVPLQWSLNLNGGPARDHEMSTDPRSQSWHWFVLDLVIGRETSRTIAGTPLAEVVPPFARATVVEAIATSLRWHRTHDAGGSDGVANAARGLRYLRTGEWGSKPDAMAWAERVGIDRSTIVDLLEQAVGGADS